MSYYFKDKCFPYCTIIEIKCKATPPRYFSKFSVYGALCVSQLIYRVAAIFPEHFQSFTVTLKNYFFEQFSAVCRSINNNKKTHSSTDKSTGSYKGRDSLQTLRRTYHEKDADLAQGEPYGGVGRGGLTSQLA